VLHSCYVACLSGKLADKERLWDDSMVPEKRRGCPLESGRKGGRNKSSASNRGRASARFYSRTLNSIAIGFSGCLVERTLPRPACFVFSLPRRFRPIAALAAPFVSFCTVPRPSISRNTSVVSYTWKPYYRRHDKIPPRRRRPLLECRYHYEL